MTHIIQRSRSTRAWSELLLLSLIWGTSFLAIRMTLDEVPFVTSVAWRVALAMGVLWAVVLIRGLAVPRNLKVWFAFLVMGALNNVIPYSLMAWGQLHIETGLTSILNAGTAVFGVLVAAAYFADERLTPRKLTGVLIGFAGVATAIGLHQLGSLDLRSLAQLAVIAGTVSYAFAGAWARHALGQIRPEAAAAGMLTGSSLIMVPAALLIDGTPELALSLTTWGAMVYSSVVATAAAYLLYYRVLGMAGSGNLLLCTLLIAPVAILLGAAVRGEELMPNAYAGFALLALGLLILDGRFFRRRALSI